MTEYSVDAKQNKDELQVESLEFLLDQLSLNREDAENRYLTIRNKLIMFFRSRGFSSVDADLADKTIDRAARKLLENSKNDLNIPDLDNQLSKDGEKKLSDSFFLSVAYFVLKEHQRAARPMVDLEDTKVVEPAFVINKNQEEQLIEIQESELMLSCFNKCLSNFPTEKRLLLVEYFSVEATKADLRQSLADKLSINLNALRVKAHRLRLELIKCVENCLKNSKNTSNLCNKNSNTNINL